MSKHKEEYKWTTFEDFKVAFRSEFSPVDETQDALAALTSKDYFQRRNEPLDDYIDCICTLACKSGMSNFGLVVMQKFKEGLSPELQTAVCNMTSPPDNTSPEDWYRCLRAIESQKANHKLIARPSAPSPSSSHTASQPAAKFATPLIRSPPEPHLLFVPPAPKPASSITLMDLDHAKTQQRPPAGTCYLCGETGHVKRDCP